eukprot:6237032-Lingulodinium_polyedra.AAC.1
MMTQTSSMAFRSRLNMGLHLQPEDAVVRHVRGKARRHAPASARRRTISAARRNLRSSRGPLPPATPPNTHVRPPREART